MGHRRRLLLTAWGTLLPSDFDWSLPLENDAFGPAAMPGNPIDITPIDLRPPSSLPRMHGTERVWCPDELKTTLFDGAANTFLLVDAAARKSVTGAHDLDLLSEEIRCQNLFKGPLAEAREDVAPYLIDVSRPGAELRKFLADFFAKHWGRRTGLFVRSHAGFDVVYRHFRGLTQVVPDPARGVPVYFRLWDPSVASVYFEDVAHIQARADRVLRTSQGDLIEMIIEDGDARAVHVRPAAPAGKRPPGFLTFGPEDRTSMKRAVRNTFAFTLADWLIAAEPETAGLLPQKKRLTFARHVIAQGDLYSFTDKKEFAYLAHMMCALGSWFHVGASASLTAVLSTPGGERQQRMADEFEALWNDSPVVKLTNNWSQVMATIGHIPTEQMLTDSHLDEIVRRTTPLSLDLVRRFSHLAQSRLDIFLSGPALGQFVLMTLRHGVDFHSDPLKPWYGLDHRSAIAAAWLRTTGVPPHADFLDGKS